MALYLLNDPRLDEMLELKGQEKPIYNLEFGIIPWFSDVTRVLNPNLNRNTLSILFWIKGKTIPNEMQINVQSYITQHLICM